MKKIQLGHMVKDQIYYIQTQNYKFKAVYDQYSEQKFHFKKIIRLNTPKDWCGYIAVYEYMYYTIYASEKNQIQTAMETRAIQKILMNVTGTEIY